jgi:FAD/FMN-containing dehydrogenase/Fe-S oxidoreductase
MDFTELKRETLARHLRKNLQGEVRFDKTSRRLYSTDASIYKIEPLGVVIPKTAEDLHVAVQIALEMHVPITARGGGTSLSGQSIGPGIVLDCSKYLNNILDVDAKGHMARIQPGVVLDQLNRHLAKFEMQFGPEVATASRANLGGMIGNNSAGSRSIIYGKTIDHVRRLDLVLSDGTRTSFGPLSAAEWDRSAAMPGFEGGLYRRLQQIVHDNSVEIQKRFPRIIRRVSGYNLDVFVPSFGGFRNGQSEQPNGLHKLIVGSEGTLGVITEVDLNIIPRPKARGLLLPHFDSLGAAMDAVAACLEFKPSAVELMDQMLLDLARNNLSMKDTMAAIQGRPAAVFMVEFVGDDKAEIADRIEKLSKRLKGARGVTALVPAIDPALRDPLWNLRSAAMPLLFGLPGDQKPVTFIEDTAVAPEHLPEFIARFQEILARHRTGGAFYGHASVGCLHIRPLLNLKAHEDVVRMRRITEDITDLVLEFGGALSGEHGDGLARSEWNRKMFGETVYEAFRQVKQTFDPHNLFNPGKIVDAPAMTENLRYDPGYAPSDPPVLFDYAKQEGFVRAVEMCNGAGVCRRRKGGTMCPSFRATLDERDSTRGRANALRLALAGDSPLSAMRQQWVYDVLDLCLMCKACKSECPSNVDMAKLKAEFLQSYFGQRPRPLGERLLANIHLLNRFGAPLAGLINVVQENRLVRWLLEKVTGIDRRRSLPSLHANHFRRWFRKRSLGRRAGEQGKNGATSNRRVLLLDDCFNTFNEPEIAEAAVRVLEAAGCTVELAGLTCCARPLISKGFLVQARQLIQAQAPALAARIADGTPILGMEPSCLLTLADEWTELVPGPDTQRIAKAADLADNWLAKQSKAGTVHLPLKPRPESCVLHGHCHQKALLGVGGTAAALRLVPGLAVDVLETGCCGMAGSFGFERDHYDISVAIANLELLPALKEKPDAMVIAPGTSCRHQIKDLAERRAWHPLEVLEASLEGEEAK